MATSTLDAIARRYSCRAFLDTAVPQDTLRAIAEAGICAPSAMNRQPWRIIVISTKDAIDEIDAAGMQQLAATDQHGYDRVQARGGRLLYNAPAMIIIASEDGPLPYPPAMDVGILTSHLTLAAAGLDVDSCIVAMARVAFQDESSELRSRYIPEGFSFAVAVLLGYAENPGSPHQVDPTKIIYL